MNEVMLDALGNKVVLGQKYGYSATDTVFTGTAISFTKSRVTLETLTRRFFIYGEETDHPWILSKAKTASIPPYRLFPIRE